MRVAPVENNRISPDLLFSYRNIAGLAGHGIAAKPVFDGLTWAYLRALVSDWPNCSRQNRALTLPQNEPKSLSLIGRLLTTSLHAQNEPKSLSLIGRLLPTSADF